MIGDPALWRFLAIQAVRLAGIALVLLGASIMLGRLPAPALTGFALAAGGLIATGIFPLLLAEHWKSKDK